MSKKCILIGYCRCLLYVWYLVFVYYVDDFRYCDYQRILHPLLINLKQLIDCCVFTLQIKKCFSFILSETTCLVLTKFAPVQTMIGGIFYNYSFGYPWFSNLDFVNYGPSFVITVGTVCWMKEYVHMLRYLIHVISPHHLTPLIFSKTKQLLRLYIPFSLTNQGSPLLLFTNKPKKSNLISLVSLSRCINLFYLWVLKEFKKKTASHHSASCLTAHRRVSAKFGIIVRKDHNQLCPFSGL